MRKPRRKPLPELSSVIDHLNKSSAKCNFPVLFPIFQFLTFT